MKTIASILLITLFSLNSFAFNLPSWIRPGRPGPYDPNHPSRPNISCTYTDTGWEEHWGGHRSCQECLSKHDNCNETCSADYYVCKAQGTDYRGYVMNLETRADSRYDAERQVMDLCQYNYRYANCHVTTCDSHSDTVSRRSCK